MKVTMTDQQNHEEEPLAPMFSLHDFKKWMDHNGAGRFAMAGRRKSEGAEVEPRVPLRKFAARMEVEEGDVVEMAREFRTNGGVVVEANGDAFLIQVANGVFRIPRTCVRRKD
jgi:hypothetical protein